MSRAISVLSIRVLYLYFSVEPFFSNVMQNSIAVHPKGTSYASGGEDGFVRVHHFDESYFKAKPYGDLEITD